MIIKALFFLGWKTSNNLQQFKYKSDIKQYFKGMLKNEKKVNQKSKSFFMQLIYSKYPPPFHMYNLAKLEACSEPSQTPKADLFATTVFNGFKSLTASEKAPPQMLYRALNSPS